MVVWWGLFRPSVGISFGSVCCYISYPGGVNISSTPSPLETRQSPLPWRPYAYDEPSSLPPEIQKSSRVPMTRASKVYLQGHTWDQVMYTLWTITPVSTTRIRLSNCLSGEESVTDGSLCRGSTVAEYNCKCLSSNVSLYQKWNWINTQRNQS